MLKEVAPCFFSLSRQHYYIPSHLLSSASNLLHLKPQKQELQGTYFLQVRLRKITSICISHRRPRKKRKDTLQRPLVFHFPTLRRNPDLQSRRSILASYSELSWHPWAASSLERAEDRSLADLILMKCQANHEDSNAASLRISISRCNCNTTE